MFGDVRKRFRRHSARSCNSAVYSLRDDSRIPSLDLATHARAERKVSEFSRPIQRGIRVRVVARWRAASFAPTLLQFSFRFSVCARVRGTFLLRCSFRRTNGHFPALLVPPVFPTSSLIYVANQALDELPVDPSRNSRVHESSVTSQGRVPVIKSVLDVDRK